MAKHLHLDLLHRPGWINNRPPPKRYAETVEVPVRIRESDTRYGSGDHDDPPEVREDRGERCYYVDWDAAGTNRSSSITGPFETVDEAAAFAAQQSRGTLTWAS